MNDQTPRCYLALRCDQRKVCWFCSNGLEWNWRAADEIGTDGWLAFFAELTSPDVVFTGGEATLHPDFLRIIAECPKYMHVYSNFASDRVLSQVPEGLNIHWRASYHGRTIDDLGQWMGRVRAMHARGYRITATTVYPPTALEPILRQQGVVIDEPQACPPPLSRARCTLPRILIAPDGQRYHCVSKLVRRDLAGIVPLDLADNTIVCEDGTRCVACDSIASEREAIA